jgi:hypothetical protein
MNVNPGKNIERRCSEKLSKPAYKIYDFILM